MAELSPRLARHDDAPRYIVVGDTYTQLAGGEDTGSTFALFHAVVPAGHGPPPHTHTREDESFYVLKGRITFHVGRAAGGFDELVAEPGDFVFAPRDVPHRFHNSTDTPAEMLIQVVPAGIERYFAAVDQSDQGDAAFAKPTPEYIERLVAKAVEYGVTIHAPD